VSHSKGSVQFFAEHADLVTELFRSPRPIRSVGLKQLALGKSVLKLPPMGRFMAAVKQLEQTAFGRILNAAALENCAEAFKETLEMLLLLMHVKAPSGVFAPTRSPGRIGRPISSQNERIYSKWIESGEPSLFKNDLAQAFYGAAFTKANAIDRRRMRDKCRRAVERNRERLIERLEMEISMLERQLENKRNATAELQAQAIQLERRLTEGLKSRSGQ
jgi:hypothetical protein